MEKLKFVETLFEEAELELIRKRDEMLSKLRSDIDEAKAGIDNLMPAITACRELQSGSDPISFIEDCQKILQGSPLKHDFDKVCSLFGRIEKLTCSNAAVLMEITKLQIFVPPETECPRITKMGHALKGHRGNEICLKWTRVKNAESYKVFSDVNGSVTQIDTIFYCTWNTSCTLKDIDGDNVPVVWITAVVDGRESLPSVSVTVPTLNITFPYIQFNHRRAGEQVCVSTDGMDIASEKYALSHLGDHFPGSSRGFKDPTTVLGTPLLLRGLLYWEVKITGHDAKAIHLYSFGVSTSISPVDHDFQADDVYWVELECDGSVPSMNVKMMHKGQCLHEEVIRWCDKKYRLYDKYGLLLDIDNRTLSVSYNFARMSNVESCRSLFTFENVDTSTGITPMFRVCDSSQLSLVNPNWIQPKCLTPLL